MNVITSSGYMRLVNTPLYLSSQLKSKAWTISISDVGLVFSPSLLRVCTMHSHSGACTSNLDVSVQ